VYFDKKLIRFHVIWEKRLISNIVFFPENFAVKFCHGCWERGLNITMFIFCNNIQIFVCHQDAKQRQSLVRARGGCAPPPKKNFKFSMRVKLIEFNFHKNQLF
jgi:hypothetical protein